MIKDPTVLFAQSGKKETGNDTFDCASLLVSLKEIVDPVIGTTDNCVLDEIYIDGLEATQVWGQVKLVFDSVEKNIWQEIEEFKSKGLYNDENVDSSQGEEAEEDSEIEGEDDIPLGEIDEFSEEEIEDQDGEDDDSDEEIMEQDDEEAEVDADEQEEQESVTDEEEDTEGENVGSNEAQNKSDDFGLNDEMFNLDDYKRQVLALEDGDGLNDDDGEDVDLFADFSDEDDEDDEMYTYNDFFDSKDKSTAKQGKAGKTSKTGKGKKSQESREEKFGEDEYDAAYDLAQADLYGDEDVSESEADANGGGNVEGLSTFEKQQRELQKQIAELEAESIAEKKWTMKGEVSSKQRESDTLLDEELEFDRTAKPVPIITQETTESIEEIIKRRIVNQEFDEVQKRIISELNNFKASKKVQVSEEKSTKSLAELYEDEYANKDPNEEVNAELKAAHDEINQLFKDVTYQLDSLYSSHFVPKPKEKLLDVRIETSTIAMEDAQPLTMAASNSLAPQEIYKTGTKVGKNEVVLKSGVVMAKSELERDDKQRLHRAKKRKQHLQSKDQSDKKRKVEMSQL